MVLLRGVLVLVVARLWLVVILVAVLLRLLWWLMAMLLVVMQMLLLLGKASRRKSGVGNRWVDPEGRQLQLVLSMLPLLLLLMPLLLLLGRPLIPLPLPRKASLPRPEAGNRSVKLRRWLTQLPRLLLMMLVLLMHLLLMPLPLMRLLFMLEEASSRKPEGEGRPVDLQRRPLQLRWLNLRPNQLLLRRLRRPRRLNLA